MTSKCVSTAESINSILVRTGVYQGDKIDIGSLVSRNLAHKDTLIDPSLVKPNFITNNVYDAVKLVFKKENY